ncbi:MAG: YggT family protein [Deltaproteobacteria bacterium]|nr:MAG: YggT family protein [Deltaproteobacteria bacterium]
MFVAANLLLGMAKVLDMLLWFYMWVLIARIVISWVNADPYNPIVRAIISVTEPLLYRIRRSLPVYGGGIDFSPLVVFAGIYFLQIFLVQSLVDLAMRLR